MVGVRHGRVVAVCLVAALSVAVGWDGALPHGVMLQTSAPSGIATARYHKTDEIWSQIGGMQGNCGSNTLAMTDVSVGGKTHKVVKVTGPGDASSRKQLLVTFNIHGRELISGETALRLSKLFCQNGLTSKASVSEALANTVITYIPVLNPSGRRRADAPDSDASHTCTNQRKNGNLVDLNRNFEYAWQASSDTGSETYPGTQAMSEPEAQLLAKLATDTQFDAYVDMHAGEDAMGWVFGSDRNKASDKESAMRSITAQINDQVFASSALGKRWTGRLAAMGGSQAYNSYGCTADYMHMVKNVPLSFTWEVWAEHNSQRRRKAENNNNNNNQWGVALASSAVTTSSSDSDKASPSALTPDLPKSADSSQASPVDAASSQEGPAPGALVPSPPSQEHVNKEPVQDSTQQQEQQQQQPEQQPQGPTAQEVKEPSEPREGEAVGDKASDGSVAAVAAVQVDSGAAAEVGDMASKDCFTYFNPQTDAEYDATVNDYADAILVLMKHLPAHS